MHFKELNKVYSKNFSPVDYLRHNHLLHKSAISYCEELRDKKNKPFIKKMEHLMMWVITQMWKYKDNNEAFYDMDVYELGSDIFRNELKLKHELGEAIKEALFTPVNKSFTVGVKAADGTVIQHGKAMSYQFHPEIMKSLLNKSNEEFVQSVTDKVKSDFTDFETNEFGFTYHTKSDDHRMYNYVISMPRELRKAVLVNLGYTFDVDINCANVSLLTNHAISLGLDKSLIQPLLNYIDNRTELREYIASTYKLDIDSSKELLTSVFMGASMSKSEKFAKTIHKIFTRNHGEHMTGKVGASHFKKDEKVLAFVKSARIVWAHCSKYERKHNRGRWNFRAIGQDNGKGRYIEKLERNYMDKLVAYLCNKGVKMLRIHDGFVANRTVDINELMQYSASIGYKVTYSAEEFNNKE